MEFKPKYQTGGSFDSFYVGYKPTPNQNQKSAPSRSSGKGGSNDNEGKATEKDLLNKIHDLEGLPNETAEVINQFRKLWQTNLGDLSPNQIASSMLSVTAQAAKLKVSKELYDQAREAAKNNGSYGEPAMADGKVFYKDENNQIKPLDLDKYLNMNNKPKILTVGELQWERAFNPSLKFQDKPYSIISNSMGPKGFQTLIDASIKSIGSSENKYGGQIRTDVLEGLKALENLELTKEQLEVLNNNITVSGLYKYNIVNKDQLKQIKALTTHILSVIPQEAKDWAKYKTGITDSNTAAEVMLLNYLTSQNDETHSITVDYEGKINSDGSVSDKDETNTRSGFWTQFIKGEGGIDRAFNIITSAGVGEKVIGKYYSALPGTDKGPDTLQALLADRDLQGVTQSIEGITFGSTPLNSFDLSGVIYDNSGGYRVTLPTKIVNGIKVVNFDYLEAYNEIIKKLKDQGITEIHSEYQTKLGEALKDAGMDNLVDSNGLPNKDKFGMFLVIQGYTTDNVKSVENTYNNEKKREVKTIEIVEDPSDQLKALLEEKLGIDYGYIFHPDVYRASVFIPISTNPLDAINADNISVNDTQARNLEYQWQKSKLDNMKSTKSK